MHDGLPIEELNKIKAIPMVFIIGKSRSGTSLLQNMLDLHPAIIGPTESKFVVLLYPRFCRIKKWKEADILRFIESLYIEPLFARIWRIDRKELTEKLLSIKEYADYSLLCKIVYYQARKAKENVLLISDKNPQYVLFLDTLLKIFPDARFVHIVREPRDNIYSHIISFNDKNPVFGAYHWLYFNKIIEAKKRMIPERFFSIKYEGLVSNPQVVMQSLCEFLKIPFNIEMTRNKNPEVIKAQIGRSGSTPLFHKELLRPLNTSNIGKWKNGMSEFARSVTEIVTAEYAMKMYGYETGGDSDARMKVPHWKILKGKYLYVTWQAFTRTRFKNFRVNLLYSKIIRFIRKDKIRLWEYF